MVKHYELQLTKTWGTKMGQESYGTAMHATEDLNDGNFLTEAVRKYVERATPAEERMAQVEAKFEGKFAMMSMKQPPQPP